MWLRRAFFGWLIPAAFLLPLWLLVGWGVFQAGAWVFLWVLFIAVPSVLIGQLVLAMLVRARPTVRAERAVSWADVAGFTVWHGLTIAVGFYDGAWFVPVLVGAILAGLALFWLSLWQLWNEARAGGSRVMLRYATVGDATSSAPRPTAPDVFIVTEQADRPGGAAR
jgi:hypothetical protein